jgi:hypothetical protein
MNIKEKEVYTDFTSLDVSRFPKSIFDVSEHISSSITELIETPIHINA